MKHLKVFFTFAILSWFLDITESRSGGLNFLDYDYYDLEMNERTFIMLKPDAIQRGLIGDIIKRFEQRGLKLVAMKIMQASEEKLEEHFKHLSDKSFYPGIF